MLGKCVEPCVRDALMMPGFLWYTPTKIEDSNKRTNTEIHSPDAERANMTKQKGRKMNEMKMNDGEEKRLKNGNGNNKKRLLFTSVS